MRLPAGGFHEFFQGGAAGPFQQVQDLGGLAALAGASRCLPLLGGFGRFVAFLAAVAFLAPLLLAGATRGFRARTFAS